MKRRFDENEKTMSKILLAITLIMIILTYAISFWIFIIYLLSAYYLGKTINKYSQYICEPNEVDNTIDIIGYDNNDTTTIITGWSGLRNYMEDEYVICMKNNIYGVFDGHGGSKVSKYIKRNFVKTYENMFHELIINHDLNNIDSLTQKALENTIIKLDTEIFDECITGGAVGTVIKLNSDKIYCANVGDSGAFVKTAEGKIQELTKPHALGNYREYNRYIDCIEPLNIKFNSVIRTYTGLMPARSIGDHIYKYNDMGITEQPETKVINITKDSWKYFVIASDGIMDSFENEELVEYVDEIIKIKLTDKTKDIKDIFGESITRLYNRTIKQPSFIDKITNKYYGDNCTLIVVFNKQLFQ
jgi:serine/threonine protein phosphatase PrpC